VFSLLQRMMPELISQQEGWNGPLLAASQGFSSMSDASNCGTLNTNFCVYMLSLRMYVRNIPLKLCKLMKAN
jgi:hypothetical protein